MKNNLYIFALTLSLFFLASCSEEVRRPDPLRGFNGAKIIADSIYFSVYIPNSEKVEVSGDFSDWEPIEMRKKGNRYTLQVWKPAVSEIGYHYIIDGKRHVADPYSSHIREKLVNAVSVVMPDDDDFEWTDQSFAPGLQANLNIYEMDPLRYADAANVTNTLTNLAEYIEQVKSIGINAVKLPALVEGQLNEDGELFTAFPMTMRRDYGDDLTLKNLVNTLHDNNIQVFIDVELAHRCKLSPLDILFREDARIADSLAVAMADSILGYWQTRFHIDGFNLSIPDMTNRDVSHDDSRTVVTPRANKRIADLLEIAARARRRNPHVVLMTNGVDEKTDAILAKENFLVMHDVSDVVSNCVLGHAATTSFAEVDYRGLGWAKPNLVLCVDRHWFVGGGRSTRTYKSKAPMYFDSEGRQIVQKDIEPEVASVRISNALVVLFALPGPKMVRNLWHFSADDTNVDDGTRAMSFLFNARKRFEKILAEDYDTALDGVVKRVHSRAEEGGLMAVTNFGDEPYTFTLPRPDNNEWREVISGKIYITPSAGREVTIAPNSSMIFVSGNQNQ